MVLDVHITQQEFLTGFRNAAKPGPRTLAIYGILFAIAALTALLWSNRIVAFSIVFGGSIGAWVGQIIQIRYMGTRVFRQQKALHRPYHVSWDDEAVKITSDNGAGSLRWSEMHKAREVDGLFVLFTSDTSFVLIPGRVFPDDKTRADFRRLMRARVARSS